MTMIWIMVGLIVVGLVYTVAVLTKYNAAMRVAQTKIKSLEKKSIDLDKTVKHEQTITGQIADQVKDLKNEESELKLEIAVTTQKLKTAQIQESSLEMDMYKHEFKKSKQRSY